MSGFKSHTPEAIRQAMVNGQTVWALDTGSDGDDDTLIGEDREELMAEIADWLHPWPVPKHWTLEKVTRTGDEDE